MSVNPISPNLSSSIQSLTSTLQVNAYNTPGMTIDPGITGIAGTDTKVAQALMVCLAQLQGAHKGYSKSYLNSTSLDSSQSIKVFLLSLMEALNFEHQNTSINTPAMQNTSNTSTSAYTGFHHPQAQTLLEDEILDLIDAVYLMNKGKTKSNNPISDLDAAAKKMFAALGIPTDDSTLTDLLGYVEKLVVGSSSSGNFINSTS